MSRSKLNGVNFPKEPIEVRWTKNLLGIRGDRRPIHSGFMSLELVMPILTSEEYNFFYGQYETGTFHTLYTTSPNDQNYTNYTGVVIDSVEGREFDVPGWFDDVVIRVNVPR